MIPLLPPPPDAVRQPLESVLAHAIEGGAPSAPWVAVEDLAIPHQDDVGAVLPRRLDRALDYR